MTEQEPLVWVEEEGDREQELLLLRDRVVRLEEEARRWQEKYETERKKRLRIGPYAPRRGLRGPPAPKLYTIRGENGWDKEVWLYRTDIIIEAIGIAPRNFEYWIKFGIIPEVDYRTSNNVRLWTKEQVELIIAVVEKYKKNGNIIGRVFGRKRSTQIREEILEQWESINPTKAYPDSARRRRHYPNLGNLPKVIRKGKKA